MDFSDSSLPREQQGSRWPKQTKRRNRGCFGLFFRTIACCSNSIVVCISLSSLLCKDNCQSCLQRSLLSPMPSPSVSNRERIGCRRLGFVGIGRRTHRRLDADRWDAPHRSHPLHPFEFATVCHHHWGFHFGLHGRAMTTSVAGLSLDPLLKLNPLDCFLVYESLGGWLRLVLVNSGE